MGDELNHMISDVKFYNSEDIVARIHFLTKLEEAAPYHHRSGGNYWTRIQESLASFPPEHRYGALALFGSVVYLPDMLLDETVSTLAADIGDICSASNISLPGEAHVFAVDHPGLLDLLYDRGEKHGWTGRLDQSLQRNIRTVQDMLRLAGAVLAPKPDEARVQELRDLLHKRMWVLLTDKALSGGSVKSDATRLDAIRELSCAGSRPAVLVAAQVLTVRALEELKGVGSGEPLGGLLFDSQFSINSEDCGLFRNSSTLEAVRRFCDWFGTKFFGIEFFGRPWLPKGARRSDFRPTVERHRSLGGLANFAYGWRDCGFTIVCEDNAPTNSVPVLWYPTVGMKPDLFLREAVFPRNDSRPRQAASGATTLETRVARGGTRLRRTLWGSS